MSTEPPAPALSQEEADEASASPPKESARGGGGAAAGGGLETNTLWVGNLHPQATEADLMAAFAPHGALDCVVARNGARGYAFVLFHGAAGARAALEALQGAKIKGAAIRNEFARPARAVRNLWVGGISPSISKEELEQEFQKFGNIEAIAFSHNQTAAYIDFEKLEDAISAHRALNGTVLSGKELCVDFQRSRGRTEWSEASNLNGRVSVTPGEMRVGSAKGSAGLRMREAQPTNVLWVGFPGLYKINEEMLRRAMAAHGVVTNIKVFPARQYAFVEFATVKEASNAKNLLDGRLFNDSRIQILFSNSELAPNKFDNPAQLAGFPRSEMYYNDGNPDYSGPGLGSHGTLQGYDPRRGRSRYGDYGGASVTGGILPSPDSGTFLAGRSAHDTFDSREAKRMRLDAGADPYDVRAGSSEGLYPVGFSHQSATMRAERSSSPAIRIQGTVHRTSFLEHFWRGSIAKGGSPVCRARCLPVRKGTEIPLPDIVNCSARTGLDMLAKHYGDASGFDIVFFLPDSEDDFVSYTEFLRYLGSKGRAGVVKVDSGTTLFLVPPSDFLTNVLQVDGPERLYGVVLHIPQMAPAAVQRPQLTGPEPQPYYNEKETVFTSQRSYGIDNQHQDADYRGSLHEESLHRMGQIPARARGVDEGQAVQPILATLPANQTAGPQAHTSLRPDIMSTLAKLLPSNSMQSSALVTGQVPLGSTDRPVASQMHDASTHSKVWKPENQAMASTSFFEHMGNLQQSGQQFSKQVPPPHLTNYGNMVNAQEHLAQHAAYNPEITLNLPPAPPPPTLPPSSAMLSSIGGHSLTTQMSQQQYQPEQYYTSQSSYGPLATAGHSNQHVNNASLPVPPPPRVNSASLAANNQMGNLSQPQHATALPTDRVNPNFSSQVQQQQNVASGAAQAPDEADKNKKYQATLQFAHNLLLQLQRGSGNQP